MRHRRCIVIEITLIYVVSGNSGWCGCFHRKGASLPRHDNPKLFLSIFYAFHGAKRHESRDQHCTNHEGVQQDGGDNPWSWICYPSLSLYLVLTLHHFSTIFQSTWAKTQKNLVSTEPTKNSYIFGGQQCWAVDLRPFGQIPKSLLKPR